MKDKTLDLWPLPMGETYENTYGQYIEIFRKIFMGEIVKVLNPPACWAPLIRYFGAEVGGELRIVFPNDRFFRTDAWTTGPLSRSAVEISVAARPELADALWKADMQWDCIFPPADPDGGQILITNYNSWYRRRIIEVMHTVENSSRPPLSNKCVMVPCAADKPYPAPLHKDVKKVVGDDWELIISSGVVGVLPERFWPDCQVDYDSAIPNFWRLMKSVEKYFGRWDQYKRIVVYSDFYAEAIYRGLVGVDVEKAFVLPVKWRKDYENLRSEENLRKLDEAIRG